MNLHVVTSKPPIMNRVNLDNNIQNTNTAFGNIDPSDVRECVNQMKPRKNKQSDLFDQMMSVIL